MRSLLLAFLFTSLLVPGTLLPGCVGIESGLRISPGERFVLGGEQRGAYRVDARNIGDATVVVAEVVAGGDTVALGRLAPGAQQTLRFRAGSAALLENASGELAELRLSITGDTNLGMRYEPSTR